jgi:clan AA aspartic protease
MGVVYADTEITNLKENGGSYACPFLVDTGATNSVAPADELEKIGITRELKQSYLLADGSIATFDVGHAIFCINGEKYPGVVVFGEEGSEPLLGLTTLEAAGLYVDTINQVLGKVEALLLK